MSPSSLPSPSQLSSSTSTFEEDGWSNEFCAFSNPPSVIQIDRQSRLAAVLGRDILTITTDAKAARLDPATEVTRFSPMLDRIENSAGKSPVLIDIGAGEVERFVIWAGLADLDEDLKEWGYRVFVLAPYLAEAEAIRQAAWTVERVQAVLPAATVVLVENQRDGRIAGLHPAAAAAQAYADHILPLRQTTIAMVMPSVPGGSWRHFEAACCRPTDVVAMSPQRIMELTGLPRAEAKIARGDIAQWLTSMFSELDQIISREPGQ